MDYVIIIPIPSIVAFKILNMATLTFSNVFEDLTKLLVENAFPLQGLMSTSLLSLEALMGETEEYRICDFVNIFPSCLRYFLYCLFITRFEIFLNVDRKYCHFLP